MGALAILDLWFFVRVDHMLGPFIKVYNIVSAATCRMALSDLLTQNGGYT